MNACVKERIFKGDIASLGLVAPFMILRILMAAVAVIISTVIGVKKRGGDDSKAADQTQVEHVLLHNGPRQRVERPRACPIYVRHHKIEINKIARPGQAILSP